MFQPNFHVVSNPNLEQFFFKEKCKSIVNSKNRGEQVRYAGYIFLLVSTFYICFGWFVCLEVAATKTCFVKHIYHFSPNRSLEPVQILCVVEHIV